MIGARLGRRGTLALVALMLGLQACTAVPAAEARSDTRRRVIVCGLDRTGSFGDLLQRGKELCSGLVAALRADPQDELILRWISDQSYLAEPNFVARFRVPLDVQCSSNPFDSRCRGLEARLSGARASAVREIEALDPPRANRTDIYGFFSKAAELLRAEPDADRWIFAATDLIDNVRYQSKPNLQGIHVVIFGHEPSADPAAVAMARERWTKFLTEHGAASVSFPSAEQEIHAFF